MSTPQMPGPQRDERQRAMIEADREDLMQVLALRFGAVPESVQTRIAICNNSETLERWILVAANVPEWGAFLNDLDAGPNAFKMVGASYEPNPTESGTSSAPHGAPGPEKSEAPSEAQKEE